MSQNQLIMSNFSNLEKRLQEKDQLLDEKESQIQEKDLQISLLNSKIQEIDQKWMPHSEFLLSNMESEDLLTYDELYSKFVELHVEKSELEEFKEVSINALMEKDSLITDLNNKILEIENKSIMYENTQFEILQDRENTRERLMCLSDKIKKEEIEQLEKKKNIETEINKEVQQKIDEHLKKSKERENELHNALNKCGEEIENLKHQLESQEKRFFIKEKVYKKDLENYSNKVDALEIKTAVDPEDVMKLNNKFTKDIEGLKREIVENKEAHSLEIQKIESEKIKFIKRVESSQSDNKKIEEIKQYLQKEIESLQRDLLLKDEIIDELKSDFKNQMIEMKEKQELEMKALEIQNKKLKQDDEIFRRKSSIIMKPLINELSSMANSNKFNFFDKLTKEISSDEEDEQQVKFLI